MGWTYEVTKFVKVDNAYQDLFEYRGESLLKAILAMLRARKERVGALRLLGGVDGLF